MQLSVNVCPCRKILKIYLQYQETEKLAIGTYNFDDSSDIMPPMKMCKERYKHGRIFAFNETFHFDSKKITGELVICSLNYLCHTWAIP